MTAVCSYEKCNNRYRPFCDWSFFKIPNDLDLRLVWLKHCCNESAILSYPKTPNWKFYICERHFSENDIQRQGTRANLSPSAVPYSNGKFCKCCNGIEDKQCSLAVERATIARCKGRRKTGKLTDINEEIDNNRSISDRDELSIDLPTQSTKPTDITCAVNFCDDGKVTPDNKCYDTIDDTPSKKKKKLI